MLVGNNELATTKNADELLVILIAMQMRWYDAGRIAQWSTSRASLEATGCCHWVSVCIASPRRPLWSRISVENTKHYQKSFLDS